MDKTLPKVSGAVNNTYYNKAVIVTFNEGTATLNDKSIKNGGVVKSAGVYTLIVTDAAKNKSMVKFTNDKTAPKIPKIKTISSTSITGVTETYEKI